MEMDVIYEFSWTSLKNLLNILLLKVHLEFS
jgi:hypothetical protein